MVESTKTATFLQARSLQEARGLDDRSDANCQCTHMCALVQQSCQCRGQPAGSFLLLLVGPYTDRTQLDRGVVLAQVQKRPILTKTVELQQQFLDVYDFSEGSIADRSLHLVSPITHRQVCVLMRSLPMYFVISEAHQDLANPGCSEVLQDGFSLATGTAGESCLFKQKQVKS